MNHSEREKAKKIPISIPDQGLVFQPRPVGRSNFIGLRNADYGEGFRMSTVPELINLFLVSLKNKDRPAEGLVEMYLTGYGHITGDTVSHYFPEGMFVEDNPLIRNKAIITPTYKEFKDRLGSHEEGGVVFSDDRSVRFTPYGFDTKTLLITSDMSYYFMPRPMINTGIIALFGGEENAEKFTQVAAYLGGNPFFDTLENVDSPRIGLVDIVSYAFDSSLRVYVRYSGDAKNDISFGVKELVKEAA